MFFPPLYLSSLLLLLIYTFILPHPPTFYYLQKSKKKSRSGIVTSNRHLFLLLFIFTFNLRSIQEHHQQCSIFKNLDVVQCFQHEVRVHLCQRLCPIGVFYELLCPITFQEVLALQLFRPLLHEISL